MCYPPQPLLRQIHKPGRCCHAQPHTIIVYCIACCCREHVMFISRIRSLHLLTSPLYSGMYGLRMSFMSFARHSLSFSVDFLRIVPFSPGLKQPTNTINIAREHSCGDEVRYHKIPIISPPPQKKKNKNKKTKPSRKSQMQKSF